MPKKIIQVNLNRSCGAQDLLLQTMREQECSLACVSEPHRVPNNPKWARSKEPIPMAAVTWADDVSTSVSTLKAGDGYVVVAWGKLVIASCYFSPNKSFSQFRAFLNKVGDAVHGHLSGSLLILGDFNARSKVWDNTRSTKRGDIITTWAATLDLRLLNNNFEPTCVRPQGRSVVDLSWASPAALQMIEHWEVATEEESLSDHRYIYLHLRGERRQMGTPTITRFPRWNRRSLNADILQASVATFLWPGWNNNMNAEEQARRLQVMLTEASNVAMKRHRSGSRKEVYWWNDNIATLRKKCNVLRRRVTRAHRRNRGAAPALEAELSQSRKALRTAIKVAKNSAWGELLDTINRDPWGRPYKIVLDKLRPAVRPICETLPPEEIQNIVAGLFPQRDEEMCEKPRQMVLWEEDLSVKCEEIERAAKKLTTNKAPGPDGIVGEVVKAALPICVNAVAECFTACLREGVFPQCWKTAKLVLLKKPGKPDLRPSSYRPICLLNEIGKLFERVLVNRIRACLENGVGISPQQYGFRARHSTVDAVLRLRETLEPVYDDGRYAVAVSLDISNAFNSLRWEEIREATVVKEFPNYLRAIVSDYLSNRWISFEDLNNKIKRIRTTCGVPQGSAFGPEAWNFTYDGVLQLDLPAGCHVLCYADDTLIVGIGDNLRSAIAQAELATAMVVRRIEGLGLKISPPKTEVCAFTRAHRFVLEETIWVRGNLIPVKAQFKYLGLILNRKWSFREHFDRVLPKADRMSLALARIMPNLRGPCEPARRLYSGVIHSVIFYGAPVWAPTLRGNRKVANLIRAVQRRVALRVAAAYRTVSYPTAFLLARIIPVEYLAERHREVYLDTRALQTEEIRITTRMHEMIRERALDAALSRWKEEYERPSTTAIEVRRAIVPVLSRWYKRSHGHLTYRMTQMVSGHGCFNDFLHRINRTPSRECSFCDAPCDNNLHTLGDCPAWDPDRQVLANVIGHDMSLGAVIIAILESNEKWSAFSTFCEDVMIRKEEAGRAREAEALAAAGVWADYSEEEEEEDV